MAAITDFIRNLVRDVETTISLRDVQDSEIEAVVRQSLATVNKAKLVAKYTHERKIFRSEYGHQHWVDGVVEIELPAPGPSVLYSTSVFERDAVTGDTPVSTSDYEVDALTGQVYFPVERVEAAALFVTYSFCNPFQIAADVLRNLANEYARLGIQVQSATMKLQYDRVSEILMLAADQTEGRGGLTVGNFFRGDRNG